MSWNEVGRREGKAKAEIHEAYMTCTKLGISCKAVASNFLWNEMRYNSDAK